MNFAAKRSCAVNRVKALIGKRGNRGIIKFSLDIEIFKPALQTLQHSAGNQGYFLLIELMENYDVVHTVQKLRTERFLKLSEHLLAQALAFLLILALSKSEAYLFIGYKPRADI